MSNRGLSNKHALPANPTWVEFERSDGDESNWPPNTTKVVDREGHVNYMRVAAIDEALSIKWRVEVGKALAGFMKLSGKPRAPHVTQVARFLITRLELLFDFIDRWTGLCAQSMAPRISDV
jgi:hypothetical protein